MRSSHRRLPFNTIYKTLLLIMMLCSGLNNNANAQNIPGLPGDAAPAAQGLGVSENKLGSVLFFNFYAGDAASSQIDTRVNITNVNSVQDIVVHIFNRPGYSITIPVLPPPCSSIDELPTMTSSLCP
jgi:hypothetical protein